MLYSPIKECPLFRSSSNNYLSPRFSTNPVFRRGENRRYFDPFIVRTMPFDYKKNFSKFNKQNFSKTTKNKQIQRREIVKKRTNIAYQINQIRKKKNKLKRLNLIKNIKIQKKNRTRTPLIHYKKPIIKFRRASNSQSKFFN